MTTSTTIEPGRAAFHDDEDRARGLRIYGIGIGALVAVVLLALFGVYVSPSLRSGNAPPASPPAPAEQTPAQ